MTASIRSFLGEWSAAERAGDAGKLDSLPTEDFAGIGPVGFLLPQAEWLTRHQQGLSYESFGRGQTTVRARGDVAIITARLTQRGTAFCNPIPWHRRFLRASGPPPAPSPRMPVIAEGARRARHRGGPTAGVRGRRLGSGHRRQERDHVHLDGAVDIAGEEIMR